MMVLELENKANVSGNESLTICFSPFTRVKNRFVSCHMKLMNFSILSHAISTRAICHLPY